MAGEKITTNNRDNVAIIFWLYPRRLGAHLGGLVFSEAAMSLQKKTSPTFGYELFTVEDTATRLHVAPTTVVRRYQVWGLRPMRIGGKLLFPSNQIAALEKRLIESGETA